MGLEQDCIPFGVERRWFGSVLRNILGVLVRY